METAIQHLLDIWAIQPVPEDQQKQGFYPILFVVSKALGVWRAILDLKRLNKHLVYRRFKMQSLQSILESIQEGDSLTSIDLMEAYLHIPILSAHQRFLRFCYTNQHYQYRALPFGLSSVPRTFKIMATLSAHLRSIPIRVQCYLMTYCFNPPLTSRIYASHSVSSRTTDSQSITPRATLLLPTDYYT